MTDTIDETHAVIEIKGNNFELFPERCVYHRERQTLLAADLHWGKAETFQKSGIAIPSQILNDDLERLSNCLRKTDSKRLLIIGDLIHTVRGLAPSVISQIARWREATGELKIHLIRGNHDRMTALPPEWRIDVIEGDLKEEPFLFIHDPPPEEMLEDDDLFAWSGHIHPQVTVRGAFDRMRLPCFVIKRRQAYLPAFSHFTGGTNISPRQNDQKLFAIAEKQVIEI